MAKFLLDNGANINAKTEVREETSLHIAVKKAHVALQQGNIPDYEKYVEIIEFLIERKQSHYNKGKLGWCWMFANNKAKVSRYKRNEIFKE
ncbi:hypothetical protein TNCT_429751 [Trichonephila clavata]|uniref:Ankyrin repeat protein n=1 Tax=Trichonephila clavata TaxID=2740835 RepID=A0A8X6JBR8_TRICU|nr:hypothetical protein TNCT_429751 [Trichonephila clavata]